ncbi:MAG: trigger factor [Thalassolituus sp. CG17_big_fil_post_rev_8_21_14_2_50_53_8]|nr:MAG: trigger factor [Thalassolituus sp. CG17_big_fil_post_rev_8_21_14_2_50_53_8]
MIQTEVKSLGNNEHEVHVVVAQSEYDRIYAEQTKKVMQKAKLPGFRPGKTPNGVINKQFGPQIREDTISELIQAHFIAAIESSGLTPAVQPQLQIVPAQAEGGFAFTMKVTTWPDVSLNALDKLKFETTTVEVHDADIDQVIERLQKSQVKFESEAERPAQTGDQLYIDFVGSIDGEEFAGGKGEDVPLVLGEGRFIPGFEEQLAGKKAGDDVMIEVSFPADYQAAHLAGKAACFATTVKSVGKPLTADNEDELAKMLGFDDAAALREDALNRLTEEAKEASYQATREAALDALLEANAIELPEAVIEQDVKETAMRVGQNMKQQGLEVTPEMFKDEAFNAEIRTRSERGLKLSVLLQEVRDAGALTLDDAEVEVEIDRQSSQYPEAQRGQFKEWIKSQKDQMASLRDALLERRCVDYVVAQAKTKAVTKPLSVWQAELDQ